MVHKFTEKWHAHELVYANQLLLTSEISILLMVIKMSFRYYRELKLILYIILSNIWNNFIELSPASIMV